MLEVLCLYNMFNLEKICHGPLREASFNKLISVRVNKCDELKHLFSISMAKSLSQLQYIVVTDCENLKVIFAGEDDQSCVHVENETDCKFEFAQLQSLTLQRLPQFTSFSAADDHENFKTLFGKSVEYPSLEKLELSSIGIEKIWPEQHLSIASYCQTLKNLSLEDCNGLKFLFSSSMAKSFEQLQHLEICNCESIEQVLETKGLGGEESISFPKLFYLELKDLPKLTRFGNGNIIEFPSLNVLIIDNCPNMRTFVSNNTCADMTVSNEPEEMNLTENVLPAEKQSLFGDKVGLPSLEVLKVSQMHNLGRIWDDLLSLESFCKVKILMINKCNKLVNIFPSDMLGRLQKLEDLDVMNCDSLEEVFELQALSGQMTPAIAAAQLGELHLCHLPNLKHVWNIDAQAILASENLIKIRVHSCRSLKSLFPASIANGLLKLEDLEIRSCLLEEIIAKDDKVEPWFRFPRLTSMTLHCLPVLKTFYPKRHISEWPVLKKLEVSGCEAGCGDLKILASELQSQLDHLQALFLVDKVGFSSLEELKLLNLPQLLHLWGGNSQPSRVFQNLATLELSVCAKLKTLLPSSLSLWNLETLVVSGCDELMSLMTLSTAKSLVNLTSINIAGCKLIEEIITHVEDKENNDDQIVLKQLNYLRLHQLPSLRSFCSLGNYAVKLPSLGKVIVGHCPKISMLGKMHLKEGDDRGHWQENLDPTTQQLFKEMVGFRGIKYLKISEFPQLKQIWHKQLLPGSFFCNLSSLVVDKCADMSSAISANLLQFLNNLEMLEVQNCDSLEQVFSLEELSVDGHPGLLPQLSHFYLIDLPKLSHICRRSHENILGFKNLKFLEVQNCGGMRYIFTASVFSGLKQLQEMKIVNCATLEVIIAEEGEEDAADKIVLPLLNYVILESLPDLTSFYSGSNILECPSLKTIIITNCTKTNAFVFTNMKDLHPHTPPFFRDKVVLPALEKLGLSSTPIEIICQSKLLATSCIQNLIFLNIDGCDSLKYLFPSCMIESLVRLQQLRISKCKSMEAVIMTEEEGMGEMMMFRRLSMLWLVDLPSLKMFCGCTGNLTQFPSLSRLVIDKCGSMTTFMSNFLFAEAEGSEENLLSDTPLFDEKVAAPNLLELKVCNMVNLRRIWDDHLNLNSFRNLQNLSVEYCHNLMNIFPSIMHQRLQELHTFAVVGCKSLEEIFDVQMSGCGRTDSISVGQLREIHLCGFPKLKHAWNLDAQAILSSEHLHSVQVHYCPNLKFLFPASIARGLCQLEELEIKSCTVEEIVTKEELVVETVPRFVFPQLTSLSLKELPVLKSFYSGIHVSDWPVLNQLEICQCDKVKILASEFQNRGESQLDIPIQQTLFLVDKVGFPNLEEIKLYNLPELLHLWGESCQASGVFQNVATLKLAECGKLKSLVPATVSLWNLQTLQVSYCKALKQLVTLSTARSLVNVTRVKIANCEMIKEIITHEGDKAINDGDQIVFKQLSYLRLRKLPRLTSFCSENYAIDFPQLERVTVGECPVMMMFSAGVLTTPKLHKVNFKTPKLHKMNLTEEEKEEDDDDDEEDKEYEEEDEERWEKNLNTTIQYIFKETVTNAQSSEAD